MEGAHKQQRQLTDMLVGDNVEAAAKRRRAQYGAAAAGRHGQSIQAARARNGMPDMKVLAEDAEAAMKAGNALVQASVEHLEEAERSWDKYVKEVGLEDSWLPDREAGADVPVVHVADARARVPGAAWQATEGPAEERRTELRVGDGEQSVGDQVPSVRGAGRVGSRVGETIGATSGTRDNGS